MSYFYTFLESSLWLSFLKYLHSCLLLDRYPLEENTRENEAEDRRCLAQVEDIIEEQKRKGCPLAGLIVEPIQSEGGDFHGSKEWFQGLQQICSKNDIVYLIDEVQTGCGPTGKMWAYEYFDLNGPPDIVSFSNKMLTGINYKGINR